MNLEHLTSFLQDQWYVAAIAVIVLLVVVKLVKTVVKWVVILAIIAGVLVYGSNYKDTLSNIKDTVSQAAGSAVAREVQDQAAKAITNEAKEAKYTKNADGSYTIRTKTIQLDGKPGSTDVKVTVAGQSFNLKADAAVQAFIDQAKQNP